MDNNLLLILLLLAFLVCLYYRNDENYTNTNTNSNSNIWKVGETLNIGDVKSSPNGKYKYEMTTNGLVVISSAFIQNCMWSTTPGCSSKIYNSNSANETVTLRDSGYHFNNMNTTFGPQYSKTIINEQEYFYIQASNTSFYYYDENGKLYNFNQGLDGGSGGNIYSGIDHIELTNYGILGYNQNGKLLFVN